MSDELFTTRMRKATREVHTLSDVFVNVKLMFALNENRVWAEGLLIFYEIFKFLEQAMENKSKENLGKLNIKQMNRTSAFEEDLAFYLGQDWKKNYKVRDSVKNYLDYLRKLSNRDSDLLMAYVYHLYMGLLSGGQILRKKMNFQKKLTGKENQGNAVTDFGGENIRDLKNQLRDRMNSIAETLDEEKKNLLIEESKNVFYLNNSIIATVKGADTVAFQKILRILGFFLILVFVYFFVL